MNKKRTANKEKKKKPAVNAPKLLCWPNRGMSCHKSAVASAVCYERKEKGRLMSSSLSCASPSSCRHPGLADGRGSLRTPTCMDGAQAFFVKCLVCLVSSVKVYQVRRAVSEIPRGGKFNRPPDGACVKVLLRRPCKSLSRGPTPT